MSLKAERGMSLVETLVCLSLLGVIMIPMLFISSAHFTNQLAKTRNAMEVSHNVSQFLNRFMEDMLNAQRILASATGTNGQISDATHLYFSYYDPIKQREIKQGYRITDLGSANMLERLVYNTSTGNWEPISPYASDEANQILLPDDTTFTYCVDNATPTCTAAPSPDKALLVRLNNWTFTNKFGTQSLALPLLDVYLGGSNSSTGALALSEAPKEVWSITADDAFASGADLRLLNMAPGSENFNNLHIGGVGSGAGTLTTISSTLIREADASMAVAPDGRAFFGDGHTHNGNFSNDQTDGNYYTYHPSTGLSTLVSNRKAPGWYASEVSDNGRVFFGEAGTGNNRFWTWKADTGLTTITSAMLAPGQKSMAAGSNGVVFFSNRQYNGAFFAWEAPNTLTTIARTAGGVDACIPGYVEGIKVTPDNRVFVGEYGLNTDCGGRVWTWHKTETPTAITLVQNWRGQGDSSGPGSMGRMALAPNGRIVFSDGLKVGTWKYGEPLPVTEIQSGTTPGQSTRSFINSNGQFFWGMADKGTGCGGGCKIFRWKEGDVAPTGSPYNSAGVFGDFAIGAAADGSRVFFGERFGNRNFTTWDVTNNTTSAIINTRNPGRGVFNGIPDNDHFKSNTGMVIRSDGRVFFGSENNPSSFWTWHETTGLSTIISSDAANGVPGSYGSLTIDPNGRFYLGCGNTSSGNCGKFWTWHETTGLSTIVSIATGVPGAYWNTKALPGPTGGVTFASSHETTNQNKWWYWTPPQPTSTVYQANNTGAPAATLNLTAASNGGYTAADQDGDGNIYYLDPTNKTVDRYGYSFDSSGVANYTRMSQFNWSTWAATVNAIASDNASNVIALLDSGNKEIDKYANRFADGTPAAPTSYSLAATTTPTGLDISNRTGNFLVLDSAMQGAGIEKYVRLFIYNPSGVHQKTLNIKVSSTYLSADATTETDFKIILNEKKNILYLSAPTIGKVFSLAMPEYL